MSDIHPGWLVFITIVLFLLAPNYAFLIVAAFVIIMMASMVFKE